NEGRRPGPGRQAEGRLAVSESLARSAMVKGGSIPVREAAIIVALFSHPRLIDDHYDDIEMLDLTNQGLRQLHATMLDALAHGAAGSRESLMAAIEAVGQTAIWEQALDMVRRVRSWPALENAAFDDAREAFAQALHLHRSQRDLHKELKAAEVALASETTEENFQRLVAIQAQFRDEHATEALIEGFGVSSGKADRQ
ncbi:MAG: DNA primase, partial [Mesorhizobium sp.]